ncbi:MAG TPA: hypothetical protein PKD83_14395 [Ignavibacteria bacterium]|nr:hypothetical protein [Ignavibacteria bacterium]
MKKKSILITAAGSLALGASLFFPKIRGNSKKEFERLKMEHIDQPSELKNVRGKEYCELFIAYRNFKNYKVGIYNNIARAFIPDSDFEKMDIEELKKESGAKAVVKNGPRYWVLDSILGYCKGECRKFSGYEFDLVGIIEKSVSELKEDVKNRKLYTEQAIERYTDWIYNKGEKMYELKSESGIVYTMQSASLEISSGQKLSDLDSLPEKLNLPAGWKFNIKIPDEDVIYSIRGDAKVIQDDLRNTYQRNPNQT